MATILLVEDDADLRYSVRTTLDRAGHNVREAGDVAEGLGLARQHNHDVIITDLRLPGDSGLTLISTAREEGFAGPILVMTSDDSVQTAVEAMKLGADEYLLKPISVAELKLVVERSIERHRRDTRLRLHERLARQDEERPQGASAAWRKAVEMAHRLASMPLPERPKDASGGVALPTVLLVGETGTGKGVLAREIHGAAAAGATPEPPFVHVNCAALPPQLIEAELFGHERGAFTDAKEAREGLFEMASGGTIFLDEIGELPLELQSKLLLVLEEGTLRRVGGSRVREVNARVIAATNRDLPERIAGGGFRSDLFYRLNTFTIQIPALRDREGDALLIAREALTRFGRRFGRNGLSLGADAERALREHSWPGNVRELLNVIQHAALLADGPTIGSGDLAIARVPAPGEGLEDGPGGALRFDFDHGPCTAEDVERELVLQALRHTRGNVTAAARLIDMQRSSLRNRIDRYGLHGLIKELASP